VDAERLQRAEHQEQLISAARPLGHDIEPRAFQQPGQRAAREVMEVDGDLVPAPAARHHFAQPCLEVRDAQHQLAAGHQQATRDGEKLARIGYVLQHVLREDRPPQSVRRHRGCKARHLPANEGDPAANACFSEVGSAHAQCPRGHGKASTAATANPGGEASTVARRRELRVSSRARQRDRSNRM